MTGKSNIYVISLVAIVAIVGLVTLFTKGGGGAPAILDDGAVLDEQGNIAGEAFAFRYTGSRTPSRKYAPSKPPRRTYRAATKVRASAPAPRDCRDSDDSRSSLEHFLKGSVSYWNPTRNRRDTVHDRCSGNNVIEYDCFSGTYAARTVKCPGTCSNGACTIPTTSEYCVDKDPENDKHYRGVVMTYSDEGRIVSTQDTCTTGSREPATTEWMCLPDDLTGDHLLFEIKPCGGECKDGACV